MDRLSWWRRWRGGWSKDTIDDFQKTFGSHACPICSFHRYGLQHGYATGATPEHRCPESKDPGSTERVDPAPT